MPIPHRNTIECRGLGPVLGGSPRQTLCAIHSQGGFKVGFDPSSTLRSAHRNIPSANKHPDIISEYIAKEIKAGRILGPFASHDLESPVQISWFGVIPKGHVPGKWRLILDLSHPDRASVNDGILPEHCSLRYLKIKEVAQALLQLGPGTEMAKIDIQNAYCIIPVAPADRHLLGMSWKGQTYVDSVLLFDLRSVPIIFNAAADALLWIGSMVFESFSTI